MEQPPNEKESLEQRMERLGKLIKEENAEPGRFEDFVFEEDFKVRFDTKRGRATVTGPAGYSIHDARPAGGEAINAFDEHGSVYGPANQRHLEAVQRMYDKGLLYSVDG